MKNVEIFSYVPPRVLVVDFLQIDKTQRKLKYSRHFEYRLLFYYRDKFLLDIFFHQDPASRSKHVFRISWRELALEINGDSTFSGKPIMIMMTL